jgi:HSP20 family protein
MTTKRKNATDVGDVGLGGMFKSLGGFLELLSNLAEQEGGEFTRSGEAGDEKKGVKAVYGFSVRVGGGGKPTIERFGNVNVQEGGRGPVVEEVREPLVDEFDEGRHLLVVAELPGVDAMDIRFEVKEDVLTLSAKHGDRKYHKELLLSTAVHAEGATSSFRNGIFELKLPKAT